MPHLRTPGDDIDHLRSKRFDDRLCPAGLRVVVQRLADCDSDEEDEKEEQERYDPGRHEALAPAGTWPRLGACHGSKSSAPRA